MTLFLKALKNNKIILVKVNIKLKYKKKANKELIVLDR